MSHCSIHCPCPTALLRVSTLIPVAGVAYLGWLVAMPVVTLVAVAALVFVVAVLAVLTREVVLRRVDDRAEAAIRERWARETEERASAAREPLALTAAARQLDPAPIRVVAHRFADPIEHRR